MSLRARDAEHHHEKLNGVLRGLTLAEICAIGRMVATEQGSRFIHDTLYREWRGKVLGYPLRFSLNMREKYGEYRSRWSLEGEKWTVTFLSSTEIPKGHFDLAPYITVNLPFVQGMDARFVFNADLLGDVEQYDKDGAILKMVASGG